MADDDRFAGLGDAPAPRRGRGEPPPAPRGGEPPPRPPARVSRYGWLIGVLVLAILVYITLNTLSTEGTGSAGVRAGARLPDFAVPLATSTLQGDANVAARRGAGDEAGTVPACAVRDPRALVSCRLTRGRPAVLAFLATRSQECIRQVDRLERARRRHRAVAFAAVAIRGDRPALAEDVRRRGWRLPVGFDADGAVANLYGVAVCPTVTFAYPGGTARRTAVGAVGDAALERELRALEAGARRRGGRPPP